MVWLSDGVGMLVQFLDEIFSEVCNPGRIPAPLLEQVMCQDHLQDVVKSGENVGKIRSKVGKSA